MRYALLAVALVACGKHGASSTKQDAAPAAVAAAKPDAAPPADAPKVAEKPTVVQVAVGAHAACAAMSDGSARCWGDNSEGELGDGTKKDSATPVTPNLRGVKQLALGDHHACALLDDGSVACWGKIGFGAQAQQLAPAAVPGVNDSKRLFSLGGASCAEDSAGKLACWGDIDAAGHVTHAGAHRSPTAVAALDHVIQLTERVALRDDGDVVFRDAAGTRVRAGATKVVEVATLGVFACGRHDDGSVECYGAAQPCAAEAPAKPAPAKPAAPASKGKPKKAKAGAKTAAGKPAAVKTAKPAAPMIVALAQLAPARHFVPEIGVCAITTAGHLACVTPGDHCTAETYAGVGRIDEVAGACARVSGGSVQCWGADGKHAATAVRGVAKASALAAGGGRACAIVGERSVACWGVTGEARTIEL